MCIVHLFIDAHLLILKAMVTWHFHRSRRPCCPLGNRAEKAGKAVQHAIRHFLNYI